MIMMAAVVFSVLEMLAMVMMMVMVILVLVVMLILFVMLMVIVRGRVPGILLLPHVSGPTNEQRPSWSQYLLLMIFGLSTPLSTPMIYQEKGPQKMIILGLSAESKPIPQPRYGLFYHFSPKWKTF